MNLPLNAVFAECPEGVAEHKAAARAAVVRSALLSTLPMEACESWRKDENDAPRPTLGTHWSLSHSAGRVAGIAARHRVGIDVEQHRLPLDRSRERITAALLCEDELSLLGLSHRDDLTPRIWSRAWTAKEAALKVVGLGLLGLSGMKLDAIDSNSARLTFNDRSLHVSLREESGFTLAVATYDPHSLHWHGLPTLAPIAS